MICYQMRSMRRRGVGVVCIALGALAAVRCGGQSHAICPTCGGEGDAAANASEGGEGSMPCPANEPNESDVCATADLVCWYGDSGRPGCRDIWSCVSGQWSAARSGCVQLPQGFCPISEPDGDVVCDANTDPNLRGDCVYTGGVLCGCPCPTTVTDGGTFTCSPSEFVCYGPPTTPGCPALTPNIGTPCSVQGVQCVYGNPCDVDGLSVLCRAGFWALGVSPCPL